MKLCGKMTELSIVGVVGVVGVVVGVVVVVVVVVVEVGYINCHLVRILPIAMLDYKRVVP